MCKRKKVIATALMLTILPVGIIGCSKEFKEQDKDDKGSYEEIDKNFEKFEYTYDSGKEKVNVHIKNAPKKAITLSQFMTEMLLALNLEDRMIGTALLDNEILPEYKDAYNKIPVIEMGESFTISKEVFVASGADFVSGWTSAISAEGTGTATELASKNIVPFIAKSTKGHSTIETVYEDFNTIGKIFNVEDKAKDVINKMKKEIAEVKESLAEKKEDEKVNVLVYDSGEKEAVVVGSGLPNNLITLAGGKNVFGDLKKSYETVSFESIVLKNPDVILIVDYSSGKETKEKKDFLLNNPALKNVNAIKNNNIHVIKLADLSPGVRNSKVIKKMNEYFY